MDETKAYEEHRGIINKLTALLYNKYGSVIDRSDIEDEATFAFLDAVRSYDDTRGTLLSTWIWSKIKWKVYALVQKEATRMKYERKFVDNDSEYISDKQRRRLSDKKQKAKQRARRKEFLSGKVCNQCGSTNRLEIVNTKGMWMKGGPFSASKAYQHEFFKDVVILCRDCNNDRKYPDRNTHGTAALYKKGCRCELCREGYNGPRRPRFNKYPDCTCLHCGHEWYKRTERPSKCPRCRRKDWDC